MKRAEFSKGNVAEAVDSPEREDFDSARAYAEEGHRLRDAFLTNFGHEIRTPLNVLIGCAELLLDLVPPDRAEEAADLSDGLTRASKRLVDNVQGVLDLAALSAGTFAVSPSPVDLTDVVRGVVQQFRPEAEAKGLVLACDVAPGPVVVRVDPKCLTNALDRLIGNALKFTRQGEVRLELGRDAARGPYVEVRDTGIGMDAGEVERLFQPFVQADSSNVRSFEGAGLGLALTRLYLARVGCTIATQSGKGEGTTMRIEFPDLELAPIAAASPGSATEAGAKPLVLVVEDDPDTQAMLRVVLASSYRTVGARSADEAREALAAHEGEVRAVLMDLEIDGDEDGLALTRWMRRQGLWDDLPILATTAHALGSFQVEARDAGCDAFLAKPITRAILLGLLERWIASGRSEG